MRLLYFKWLIVLTLILLAGCASPAVPGSLSAPETRPLTSPQPSAISTLTREATKVRLTAVPLFPLDATKEITLTTPLKIEAGMQPWIEAAASDLMKRLSVTHNAVEVVSAQSVVWPDKGLGCPEPGMQYLQVPVDGFRIELRVNKQLYAYHGGGGRDPFLCESPRK
jgi:hypothetical protein